MSRARDRRRLGLSLLEAIVVLVISSMVLSIVLPLASRSIRDNVRIGARGLDAQQVSIEEEVFRRLVRGAVQRPPAPGETPNADIVVGDGEGFSAAILAEAPAGCASGGRIEDVRIAVENTGDAVRLTCAVAERRIVLLDLPAGSDAAFSYSWDGDAWSSTWPNEGFFGVNEMVEDAERPTQRLVAAPLVRLSLASSTARPTTWIERAGRVAPVAFGREMFGPAGSAVDQNFVP